MVKPHDQRRRPRLGDILEVPLSRGFGYVQYAFNDRGSHGELIRVFSGVHLKRPDNFWAIAKEREQFITFFRVGPAAHRRMVQIVDNQPIPDQFKTLPTFRTGGGGLKWNLFRHCKLVIIRELTAEQRKLPIREIIPLNVLVDRIERGWRPEDEV